MKKIKVLFVFLFVTFGVAALTFRDGLVLTVKSYVTGPPAGVSGALGEATCSSCHIGSAGAGQFTIIAPTSYIPGQTYQVVVRHLTNDTSRRRWGFELTALSGFDAAGTFSNLSGATQTLNENGRFYIEHTLGGSFPNQIGGAQWTFNWTAPAANVGPVTFYASGNQANNDGSSNGDQIYTTSADAQPPAQMPTLSINNVTQNEGNSGTTPFSFTVTLSEASTQTVTVNYATADGTATAPGDYIAVPSTQLTFNPGEMTKNVTVLVNGNSILEPNETFSVNLNGAANANITVAQGIGTINNDDRRTQSDFDGDGKSDIVVFRESEGNWYFLNSLGNTFGGVHFGIVGDRIVPGDYDGDGKTDFAVWRPSSGTWFILNSTGGFIGVPFGLSTDLPAQGDYDNDGKTDIAVWRPSNGTWFLQQSTAGFAAVQFGASGDRPVPGDYDGDGKTDVAVFRPSEGNWYLLQSTAGFGGIHFGIPTDKVVPADFDGDGKTDVAVFRVDGTGQGVWFLLQSTAGFAVIPFGTTNDIPAPGDFDGDSKADTTVFRPSNGIWFSQQTTSGFVATQFGQNGDKPVAAGYVPVQ